MKSIHYILICCFLGFIGCSKNDSHGGLGQYYSPCPYTEGTIFYDVTYQPISSQEITIFNSTCYYLELGDYKLEHTSDTITYDIPVGNNLCGGCITTFTTAQIGFQIDTIADTLYLKLDNDSIIDTWYH